MTVAAALLTTAACTGTSGTRNRDPAPTGRAPSSVATTARPSVSPSPTDAALTVSESASKQIGADTIDVVWTSFRSWVLTATFDAELISTGTPTPAQLSDVTARLAPQAVADLNADVAKKDPTSIQAIETLVAVGATSPGHTLLPGDSAVTGRQITAATADIDTTGHLVLTVDSRARIHYMSNVDSSQRAYSTFTRHVAYTVAPDSTDWRVTTWLGTYDTAALTPE